MRDVSASSDDDLVHKKPHKLQTWWDGVSIGMPYEGRSYHIRQQLIPQMNPLMKIFINK